MSAVRKTFRNRVIAEPAGKRMTAREALGAEPDTAEDAEAFNSVISILRTGGLEATRAGEENGEIDFVAAEGEKSEPNTKRASLTGRSDVLRTEGPGGHKDFKSLSSSVIRTEKGAVATLGLG